MALSDVRNRQGCVLWLDGARTAAPTSAVTLLANVRLTVMLPSDRDVSGEEQRVW